MSKAIQLFRKKPLIKFIVEFFMAWRVAYLHTFLHTACKEDKFQLSKVYRSHQLVRRMAYIMFPKGIIISISRMHTRTSFASTINFQVLLSGFCEHIKTVMTQPSLCYLSYLFIISYKILLSNFDDLVSRLRSEKLNGCVSKNIFSFYAHFFAKINFTYIKLFEDAMNNFKQSSIIYRHEEWMPSKNIFYYLVIFFNSLPLIIWHFLYIMPSTDDSTFY